ncbi:MAG: hypothetical protein KTR29_17985 [Rhodothermaceae bacterium]|nr:hypothetical protein [Rhodothermaceae bacterium]
MTSPQRIQIKLYTKNNSALSKDVLIDRFHSWIQHDLLDEIPIDVADYSHVVDGPGILLITHEADYAFDEVGGAGLRYVRKKEMPGSLEFAITQGFLQVVKAARLLEQDTAGTVSFDLARVEITILDRRLYPNSSATTDSVQPVVTGLFSTIFKTKQVECARVSEDARFPFALTIRAPHTLEIDEISPASVSEAVLVPSL